MVLLRVVEGAQVEEVVLLLLVEAEAEVEVELEEGAVAAVVGLGQMPLAGELASGCFVRIRVRNDLVAKERVVRAT